MGTGYAGPEWAWLILLFTVMPNLPVREIVSAQGVGCIGMGY
jgi:hypothetical protein